MNHTAIQVIEQCAHDSYAGTKSFGEVVGALSQAGIESYHADYRAGSTTYYLPDGSAHSIKLARSEMNIPTPFNIADLQAAIRGAQRGEVKYPEFVKRSMQAGCVGYCVWIAGRHVTYFGRHGEQHIERFPS
jgi:uncharacterized protein YbcV (DUF1398 family)